MREPVVSDEAMASVGFGTVMATPATAVGTVVGSGLPGMAPEAVV